MTADDVERPRRDVEQGLHARFEHRERHACLGGAALGHGEHAGRGVQEGHAIAGLREGDRDRARSAADIQDGGGRGRDRRPEPFQHELATHPPSGRAVVPVEPLGALVERRHGATLRRRAAVWCLDGPKEEAIRTVGEPVIRTTALSKTYGTGVVAVDGLDLEVYAGEIFGLLGPNGAGKTTTVGMLTTRVIPTSGHAMDRRGRRRRPPHRHEACDRRRLADEHPRSQPVGLGEPLPPRQVLRDVDASVARSRRTNCSNGSGSPTAPHADVNTLSGGMAQRLMVARSIVHHPSILFLDEPTSGLDPQSRLALWEILGEIHGDGQTILLTTHYMEEADRLCSRVAIMDHGHLLALDRRTP